MPSPKGWKSGVYCILNTINGKRYIGSAARCFKGRLADHKLRLKSKTHANRYLQNAWNKYGEKAFQFMVITGCCPSLCIEIEQQYIDLYNSSNSKFGYNICPRAGSRLGTKLSPEVCAKFSIISKEKMNRPEVRAKLSAGTIRGDEEPRT